MSKFASRENSLTEQRVIGRELEALLDAVEVTGLNAWERAKKLHGAGLAGTADTTPPADRAPLAGSYERGATTRGRNQANLAPAVPASPVQTPLFEEAA